MTEMNYENRFYPDLVRSGLTVAVADAFGTIPEFWLNLQMRYDLWHAIQEHKKIRRLPGLRAA